MRIVKSGKIVELSRTGLCDQTAKFDKLIVDLGTGDGRFVYKSAVKFPKTFYIGVDPAEKQMAGYSKKCAREKLVNALYVVGSIELLPTELTGLADEVVINLPWGSLLEKLVKSFANAPHLAGLAGLLKADGILDMVFGYDAQSEPSETKRLDLPILDLENLQSIILGFEASGLFKCVKIEKMEAKEIGKLESTWAKSLEFGKARGFFRITLKKI